MNAVITGATKGIGRAIANLFVSKDINISICSRSLEDLKSMKEDLQRQYPEVQVHIKETDVQKKEEVIAFAEFTIRKMGKVDILINNAGIFLPGEVTREPSGNLEKTIETNLYSAYYLTRRLLPEISTPGGHIFNICSVASLLAYPNGGAYSISKFALYGFSKALREELKQSGIKVTSVLPGATWSNSWEGVDLPQNRLMEASDIAWSVWSAAQLSPSAVVEDIVIRPQLGDL